MRETVEKPATGLKVFERRSVFHATADKMFAFHAQPRALFILTPPPIFVQALRDDRSSLTNGEIEFRLWLGPVPVRWLARHEPGPTPTSFVDRMVEGPLAYWEHQHLFHPLEGGVMLVDHITLAHKPGFRGLLSRLVFDGLLLRVLFMYRHLRTRLALRA